MRERTEMKTVRLMLAATAVLTLVATGCQDPEPLSRTGGCNGQTESMESRDYCVYKESAITETGFSCPTGFPARHEMEGVVVCARSEEPMPEEHKDRVKTKYVADVDTGIRPDLVDDDTGTPDDVEPDASSFDIGPNQCSKMGYRAYRDRPYADENMLPWKVIQKGADPLPDRFDATWKGIESLNSPVSFDCPPTAGDLGLNCTTSRALVFERSNGGTTETIKIAVSLPLQSIDFPASGTAVEVTARDSYNRDEFQQPQSLGLSVERKSDGRFILALRGEVDDANDGSVDATHGPVRVSVDAKVEDPNTAFCVTRRTCKVYRLEPLTVHASTTQSVNPGGAVTIESSAGQSYQFWHLVSMRRGNGRVQQWGSGFCTDLQMTFAVFAYGLRK